MALTTNRELDHYVDQELRTLPVAASQHVFKGALVGTTTAGFVRPLTAGDALAGVAYEEQDNSAGADGALSVRLYTLGDFGHALAGAVAADIGRPVFASGDDTLTFVGGGNSFAGVVRDIPSSGQVLFRLDTDRGRMKTFSYEVENLTAGQDISTRSIHSFELDGWVASARIVNQATTASGIDNSNTCVVTLAAGGATLATVTFDATTTFPAANQVQDLGAITNAHASAGSKLTLAITNGTSANPGAFTIEVEYV